MRPLFCYLGIFGGVLLFTGCSAKSIGIGQGGLSPCPKSPNCVSSQAQDEKHRIEPLPYRGTRLQARENIKAALAKMDNVTIVTETDDYLHVEFRSRWFKFVDDVEFWFPENSSLIHIRSASRLGYGDLGVNRKRTEQIRMLFTELEGRS
ncbi:MAG: DUF1499 domain-containing protein [Desulfatitalea sp.]|nr:DUF1499 domain-containing protein [Desulfatitalea sp.]NNK01364.1 DUF1499 domain-containing protein [Desulfatitalea sp.]